MCKHEYTKEQVEQLLQKQRELCAGNVKVEQHNPSCILAGKVIQDEISYYNYYPDNDSILNAKLNINENIT